MTVYEEMESSKSLRIVGGVLSVVSGGISLVAYVAYFIWGLIFGYIALIFGHPEVLLLLLAIPIVWAGAALLFAGGIVGFTRQTKVGAILSLIGSIGVTIFNLVMIYLITQSELDPEVLAFFESLLPITYMIIPVSIVGIIGAIILFIAIRKTW